MKIINERPPAGFIAMIRTWGMEPNIDTTCYTIGDTLYNPGGKPLPREFIAHEETHMVQQMPQNLESCSEPCSTLGKTPGPCDCGAQARNSKRVAENVKGWWDRYCQDQYFRIDQEAEAFAIQYLYYRKYINHDRNASAKFLYQLAAFLAGPTYGKVIGQVTAQRMIQSLAGKIKI